MYTMAFLANINSIFCITNSKMNYFYLITNNITLKYYILCDIE